MSERKPMNETLANQVENITEAIHTGYKGRKKQPRNESMKRISMTVVIDGDLKRQCLAHCAKNGIYMWEFMQSAMVNELKKRGG